MSVNLIKRDILNKITPWLNKEKILIIKGARQVGKTTILKQLQEHIEKTFPEKHSLYLSADDLNQQQIFSSLDNLESYISQKTTFPNGFTFLFIDEFQYVKQAGLFLKNIFDKYKGKNNLQIIVSGSSSLEITKNQEFLTGRALEFMVERISFKEFFIWKEKIKNNTFLLKDFKDIKIFYQNFQHSLESSLKEYLVFGGYPEVLTTKTTQNKKIILESIIKTYLEKDIASFLRIENVSAFNGLLRILSAQIGSLINISNLSQELGIATETIRKYLNVLEGTYVFQRIRPYHRNVRKEIVRMPKIYILDSGIKSYFSRSWDINQIILGEVIENFVYLTLKTKFQDDYILFYRTKSGTEIDFITKIENDKINLIESKYRSNPRTNALKNFRNKYPDTVKHSIIITKDKIGFNNNTYYIPAVIIPFIEFN
jgi:predicted AAA+ superfamily ATPase